MSDETRPVEGDQIDQGVPVGDADVQADVDRASDEDREPRRRRVHPAGGRRGPHRPG